MNTTIKIDSADELFPDIPVEEMEDEHITIPFDPGSIDIDTKQPTISNIVDLIKNKEIDLSPDFQRSPNLWSYEQQSRLIESILLRIPLPAFYFDVESKKDEIGIPVNKWHVIDGLQRLCSISNFLIQTPERKPLMLSGLEFLCNLNGKVFSDLPGPYQRLIQQTQLIVYLIKPGTSENVKFNIFKRVNTGGMPLTQQEIRHALNQGIPAKFLEELASSDHFVNATRRKIDKRRMLDREFVNRFLAFYLLDRGTATDLDSFLNKVLRLIGKKTEQEREQIKMVFFDSLDTIFQCLKEYAFCKLDSYPKIKPINKVLFEVLTVSVANLSYEERAILRKKDCLEKYVSLFSDAPDSLTNLVSVSTGDKNRINQRYQKVENFLKEVIHA